MTRLNRSRAASRVRRRFTYDEAGHFAKCRFVPPHAAELLESADGKYRALVTDINLGRDKLDGWGVAGHAREIDPVFSVVYMSGDSADDWASSGVPDSIMRAKPFAPAQLVTAVAHLLNGGPPGA